MDGKKMKNLLLISIVLSLVGLSARASSVTLQSHDIGDYVEADQVAGKNYVKSKIVFGADGTVTNVSNANPLPIAGTISVGPAGGSASIAIVRNIYSSTNVTTTAYVQLVASTSDTVNSIQVTDTSGQTLKVAVGAAGFEVDQFIIPPGASGSISLLIPAGSRISVEAMSATANTGELDLTLLK